MSTATESLPLTSSADIASKPNGGSVSMPRLHTNGASTPNGLATPKQGESLPNVGDMEAKCGGCHKVIDQESGGVVVAFGSSLWHVDCFRCAKCHEKVSADTNLLLLSDGSPVCGNCSYQCFVCKKAITEEAIMTGDESYHAHCFTCRTCKRRIEELVFAKTSQGIYCMACHNDRVAKSRRHAEHKRQRAARKEREQRDEESRRQELPQQSSQFFPQSMPSSQQNLLASPAPNANGNASDSSPQSVHSGKFSSEVSPPVGSTPNTSEEDAKLDDPPAIPSKEREPSRDRSNLRTASPAGREAPAPSSPESSTTVRARSADTADRSPQLQPPSRTGSPSLGIPGGSQSPGTPGMSPRGGNAGLGVGPVGGSGLGVPTTKAERRRSINPAMTFNIDPQNSTFAVEPRMAPLPPSPLRASFTDLAVPDRRSPTTPSPIHPELESFPFRKNSDATPSLSDQMIPPRTSSVSGRSRRGTGGNDSTSESEAPPVPKLEVANGTNHGFATPQLKGPELPPMGSFLSDPDFASILNNIDRPRADGDDISPTASPNPESALSRSPGRLDILAGSEEGRSRSPSGSKLSPPSVIQTPSFMRTRQLSGESTHSVSARLGPDSSFANIVALVASAKHDNQDRIPIDLSVLVGIIGEVEDLTEAMGQLRQKYTGAKRSSQQYSEGLTVAGEEYDREVAMRRELEAEISRLRAQVHTQTARLSVISGDERRQETMRRRSHDLASSLTGLERDISRLRAQRDMQLAEVEELTKSRNNLDASNPDATAENFRNSLTTRLDTIKEQYREELEPLTAQREALQREIADLRETREQFLEESTALAAKNDELVELNQQLSRQVEAMHDTLRARGPPTIFPKRTHPSGSPSLSSLATSATLHEVPEETARVVKVTKPEPIEQAPARRFKWYKSSKGPEVVTAASISKPLALPPDKNRMQRPSTEFGLREHSFTQHSTMRFMRCELCSEKMWGLQEVRCSSCGVVCHAKCSEKLPKSCSGSRSGPMETIDGPLPPSMFGRDLGEQVISDKAQVPVIVTKCIYAVEAVGMEYEGIYRKTGGSSQSKQITSLFEKGDYDAFDLSDVESFNDISSVTSVLKTYFRQLPNPLLTHALHESFVAAASIRDAGNKHTALCALLKELPKDHYNTLRTLMLHLNRVTALSNVNLMTSQNLGVVFGPTLMRSADPNREFGDMAGKALSIQWMVDNAPSVFAEGR